MSNKNLVYNTTDYQKHLWKYHKMVDQNAKEAERVGRERYEAFPDFSQEVFHRMFVETPEKLEEPVAGSEIFQMLHDKIDEIPEVEGLRERCRGNERWSGIGTAAIIDTLLESMPVPEQAVEDIRGDEEIERYMRKAIEDAEGEEDVQHNIEQSLADQLDPNNPNGVAARAQRNREAMEALDDTSIRNALRKAVQAASTQIQEEEAMLDSLSFGVDPHSGKKARKAIQAKLSKVLGDNKRVKEIAKLAGRLRRIAIEQQRQKPQHGSDEVAGIELGNNLQKMIPAEALFMDDEIDMVFASKIHEQSLAQFELSKVPKKEQGPIVMLVDSSGSMAGGADMWAAGVALAFLEIAYKQKRAFCLVFFGGDVIKTETYSSLSNIDHEDVLETISFFAADGGTNFEKPLTKAIEMIQSSAVFTDADVIMITDGYAPVSDEFLRVWSTKKNALGFKCFSILVGSATDTTTNKKFSDETIVLNNAIKDDTEMHKLFKRV